jgi:hypothetical protein
MEQKTKNIISYESSKWNIKLWRQRWYLYAIFLHLKNYINPLIWIEFLLGGNLDSDTEKKMKINWKDIKYHVELSKMYKFSSRYERQD